MVPGLSEAEPRAAESVASRVRRLGQLGQGNEPIAIHYERRHTRDRLGAAPEETEHERVYHVGPGQDSAT